MNGDGKYQNNPGFCPVCGLEFRYAVRLPNHLQTVHMVFGRDALMAHRIVWREVICALLEITHPQWRDPLVEGP